MKTFIKNIIPAAVLLFSAGLASCTDDLDVTPIDPNMQSEIQPDDLLRKCYANMSLAGQSGPDGDCDIDGLDGGTTGFIRQLWNTNELPTDEAICNWGDPGIGDYNYASYGDTHPMAQGLYYRLYAGVTYCNQYLTNFPDEDARKIAEVRYLRAMYYYFLMDAYGNVPFTTEISAAAAPQIKRADLFTWIESELKDLEQNLPDAQPKTDSSTDYGRVDKAAVWILLSRMYLNAEVYTGTAKWAEAKEYAKKVMDSSYKLYTGETKNGWTAYQQLFMGDNGSNGASVEGILPVLSDGLKTAAYGNSEFIIASSYDAAMIVNPDGATTGNNTNQNWAGNRARKSLVDKFFPNNDAPYVHAYAMPEAAGDDRAILDGLADAAGTKQRNITQANANQVTVFVNGFGVAKFNNFYTTGSAHDFKFADTDFFLFRVAEAYLTFAEADARLNGGNTTAEGTKAINDLRARAHASQKTNGNYDLNSILDEWSREFYFEGRRRVDLIRFGKFGGNNNYNWPWKGGAVDGTNFPATKNLYAIPANDLSVNKNLVQNPGY